MSPEERIPVAELIEHIERSSARSAFKYFAVCGVLLGLLLLALRMVPALDGDSMAQGQVMQGGVIACLALLSIPFIRSGRYRSIAALVIALVFGIITFNVFGLQLGTRSASAPFTVFGLLLTLTVFGVRAGLAVMGCSLVLLAGAALAELAGFISGPLGDRFVNTELNLLSLAMLYLFSLGFSILMDRQSIRLEQALRERRAALRQTLEGIEQVQSSKERFLKSLSTDIEAPLHGMVQAIESIQAQDKPAVTDAGSISRMSTRVMQFLESALGSARRLSTGGLDLEMCSPAQMLQIRCDHWARAAQAKGLSLVQDIDASFAPVCVGATQLYLDAINAALDNAIRYTVQGSVLVRLQAIDRDTDTVTWRLVISDTGSGIAEPVMQRIRQFLRQDVDAEPSAGMDTGLSAASGAGFGGLLSIKRWIAVSDGQADVLSHIGQGCIVVLTFELRRAGQ